MLPPAAAAAPGVSGSMLCCRGRCTAGGTSVAAAAALVCCLRLDVPKRKSVLLQAHPEQAMSLQMQSGPFVYMAAQAEPQVSPGVSGILVCTVTGSVSTPPHGLPALC